MNWLKKLFGWDKRERLLEKMLEECRVQGELLDRIQEHRRQLARLQREKKTLKPESLEVEVGNLRIVNPGYPEKPFAGWGTKVYLDGKEIGVSSLDLHIAVDDVVTAKIEMPVTGATDALNSTPSSTEC